jgi:hypothetical protein
MAGSTTPRLRSDGRVASRSRCRARRGLCPLELLGHLDHPRPVLGLPRGGDGSLAVAAGVRLGGGMKSAATVGGLGGPCVTPVTAQIGELKGARRGRRAGMSPT